MGLVRDLSGLRKIPRDPLGAQEEILGALEGTQDPQPAPYRGLAGILAALKGILDLFWDAGNTSRMPSRAPNPL